MTLSGVEQETIVNFNEAEDFAEVYTASKRVASKLKKAGLPVKQETADGWWFVVPKQAVRVKVGRRTVRLGQEGRLRLPT